MAQLKSKLQKSILSCLAFGLISHLFFISLWGLSGVLFLSAGASAIEAEASAIENVANCHIPLLKKGIVRHVSKQGLLQLENGEEVRLTGLVLLRLYENATSPLARKLNDLARQTVALLRQKLVGQTVTLRQKGRKRDRYDRLLAHVFAPDGQWMQKLLLQKGLARSFSYADNHVCMAQMLAIEGQARKARLGLWAFRLFTPQSAEQVEQLLHRRYRFTLVEGRVKKTALTRKWAFINFGDNWHNDFSIAIKKKYFHKMQRKGFDLQKLQGQKIRVRGWIERWNGPLIKVTHKEQIELLSP